MDPQLAGRRRNPIEQLVYFPLPTTGGRRPKEKEEVIRTNRAICALRQLWSGTLDGALIGTTDSGWKASKSAPMGAELAYRLRARVRECIAKRPETAPVGSAAVARQLGVRPKASGPPHEAGTRSSSSLPKRGDIWPATVANIALPPAGTLIVPIREISKKAKFYLDAFEEKMLNSASELEELTRDVLPEDKPYVDPALRAQMVTLAVRMAQANMIIGVKKVRSTVDPEADDDDPEADDDDAGSNVGDGGGRAQQSGMRRRPRAAERHAAAHGRHRRRKPRTTRHPGHAVPGCSALLQFFGRGLAAAEAPCGLLLAAVESGLRGLALSRPPDGLV
jgi:hypothetical protein